MKQQWINHKGKKIFRIDYSGLSEQEMIKQLEEGTQLMLKQQEPILYLGIFTNTVLTTAFMNRANQLGKETEKIVARSALIGISGMKSVLVNTYNMLTGNKMRAFKDEEEAKEFLIKN